ncbi:MAG: LEA type 2 family protein [Bacteroidetes bacterium]|nr:LEA type 2 family protein [Bacteroidales bacterium]NJO68395.1 LEA type 2 family protein [Bacteroidota bacterium]
MKKLLYILFISLISLSFSSCVKLQSLEISKFKDFEIVDFKDNVLTLRANIVVSNPNPVKMKISDAKFDLKISETVVGHLSQMDKLVLPARSENEYPVMAKFQITNLKNGLMSLIQIVNRRDAKISVTGSVVGKTLLYRKTFDFKDIKIYE